MKIKQLLLVTLCCMISTASMAQIRSDIMKVLDKCSSTIKKSGNIRATFVAAQFNNKKETGSTDGIICVSGNKLFIDAGGTKIWYDGKTEWSYTSSTKEVNVSVPTKEESAKLNPYSFIYLYKKGYKASMSDATVRGKKCYDVKLTSTGAKGLKYVYLTIDKATMLPICIRMSVNSVNWTRISVYEVNKHQKFKSDTFRFNVKDFPGTEIIDLR